MTGYTLFLTYFIYFNFLFLIYYCLFIIYYFLFLNFIFYILFFIYSVRKLPYKHHDTGYIPCVLPDSRFHDTAQQSAPLARRSILRVSSSDEAKTQQGIYQYHQ